MLLETRRFWSSVRASPLPDAERIDCESEALPFDAPCRGSETVKWLKSDWMAES